MNITFPDSGTERLFNNQAALRAAYAPPLPDRVMLRLAVLRASPSLAGIPARPPFGLRRLGNEFLVDLTPDQALRIRATDDGDAKAIRSICVMGLHPIQPKRDRHG